MIYESIWRMLMPVSHLLRVFDMNIRCRLLDSRWFLRLFSSLSLSFRFHCALYKFYVCFRIFVSFSFFFLVFVGNKLPHKTFVLQLICCALETICFLSLLSVACPIFVLNIFLKWKCIHHLACDLPISIGWRVLFTCVVANRNLRLSTKFTWYSGLGWCVFLVEKLLLHATASCLFTVRIFGQTNDDNDKWTNCLNFYHSFLPFFLSP